MTKTHPISAQTIFQALSMPFHLLTQHIKRLLTPSKQAVIIVGVDYGSYQIHNAIKDGSKRYFTAFFIDEEPWTHRNYIDDAQLRYPVEWRALCQNHQVAAVICTSTNDRNTLMEVKDRDSRELSTKVLVISPAEIKQCRNIDRWLTRKIDTAA